MQRQALWALDKLEKKCDKPVSQMAVMPVRLTNCLEILGWGEHKACHQGWKCILMNP